jgi:hypothetical protein
MEDQAAKPRQNGGHSASVLARLAAFLHIVYPRAHLCLISVENIRPLRR